jgi:RimJ/RimL family protein N-acetyltransferase
MFVLDVDGEVVGYSTIEFKDSGICEVGFYVGRDWQGRGYGHILVRRTIDYCIHILRADTIVLELLDTNIRARNLYTRHGLSIWSTRVIDRLGSPAVVLTMGLTVPESKGDDYETTDSQGIAY